MSDSAKASNPLCDVFSDLVVLVEKLHDLLLHRHPGLTTWRQAFFGSLDDLVRLVREHDKKPKQEPKRKAMLERDSPRELVEIRARIATCSCHACRELRPLVRLIDEQFERIESIEGAFDDDLGPKQASGPPHEEQLIPCPACCPCGPLTTFLEARGPEIQCPSCARRFKLEEV